MNITKVQKKSKSVKCDSTTIFKVLITKLIILSAGQHKNTSALFSVRAQESCVTLLYYKFVIFYLKNKSLRLAHAVIQLCIIKSV